MSKIFKISALFILIIAMSYNSKAQLNQGQLGIGAMFAGSLPYATVNYVLAPNMDISVGLLYESEKYDSDEAGESNDSKTTLGFKALFKYFLNRGKDVSPFVGGYLNYIGYPTETFSTYEDSQSLLGLGAIFGAQVFLAKGFAVYGYAALGYEMHSYKRDFSGSQEDVSSTRTKISLSGSGVGAVFYF